MENLVVFYGIWISIVICFAIWLFPKTWTKFLCVFIWPICFFVYCFKVVFLSFFWYFFLYFCKSWIYLLSDFFYYGIKTMLFLVLLKNGLILWEKRKELHFQFVFFSPPRPKGQACLQKKTAQCWGFSVCTYPRMSVRKLRVVVLFEIIWFQKRLDSKSFSNPSNNRMTIYGVLCALSEKVALCKTYFVVIESVSMTMRTFF